MAPARFGVGVTGLNKLAAELRRAADKELTAELRTAFQAGAGLVANRARSNFSWSTRIPGTVRVFNAYGNITRTQVRAGGAKAPHAAAYEHGGQTGTFRHPVFGDRDVWVEEDARPGLMPALVAEADAVVEKVEKGIDEAFRKAGAR